MTTEKQQFLPSKEDIENESDISKLEELIKNEPRISYVSFINRRLSRLRIERNGFINLVVFDKLVNKIPWCEKDKEKGRYNNDLREEIYKRDNYTCQLCNGTSRDDKIACHHIIPDGPANKENLITLCYFCHDKIHLIIIKKGYAYAKNYARNWYYR